jgi:mono/diheme cytochrome c family protein
VACIVLHQSQFEWRDGLESGHMTREIVAVFLLVGILGLPGSAIPREQVKIMPGSVMGGAVVLRDKGCLDCHAINGRGGNRAPDFAKPSGHASTPELFATEMWNHTPRMWAEFKTIGRDVPPLTSLEAADLFAYFYGTLYFAPRGDPAKGEAVFKEEHCVSCHSEVLDTRPSKSLTEKWTDLRDPIVWAERMWNHSTQMSAAMANRGLAWPKLSEQDVADLLAFLSKLPASEPQSAAFNLGEPPLGRNVFDRECESCHTFGKSSGSKVDLLARPHPSTVTGYIAAMWNHAPLMRRSDGSTVVLKSGEMRDLVAFLFTQRFFFEPGDPAHGAAVYKAKGCAGCHEDRRKEPGAPDLTRSMEAYSPITLMAAAWRHGPSMLATMKNQGIQWPEFQGSEMKDLMAYLNSRLIIRLAQPGVE